MSVGYISGFKFVYHTTELKPQGIQENYNGNEEDESADVMKFRKPEREILTTIHNHIISFSLIFALLGGILLAVPMSQRIKSILLVEPFVSTILTFGGIWLMWNGIAWFKYIVMISGILISLSFLFIVFFIFKGLLTRPSEAQNI